MTERARERGRQWRRTRERGNDSDRRLGDATEQDQVLPAASSRRYPDRQIHGERIQLHQQNPATATLAAFSSAMGRYSASRQPPPRAIARPVLSPASRTSSVFRPYRCFRSTPSILPLTYPSSPTIVPFSHPFRLLPLRPRASSVSTSSSFSSDHLSATFPPPPPPPLLPSVASSIGVPVD